MTCITIPVVAHRMFGLLYSQVGTVWSKVPTLVEKPLLLGHPYGFSQETEVTQEEGNGEQEMLAHTSYASYMAKGTRRTIQEIRDLFDGEGRADGTGELSINQVWETVDIRFRLIAIVDHAIRTDHAYLMDDLTPYADRFNQTGVVNMYFVRSLDGALGVGKATPWPHDASKNSGYAAMEDWEETEVPWEQAVWIAAHEIGHLLSLPHEGDIENLMWPWTGASGETFRTVQVAVARDYAMRYLMAAHELSSASRVFRRLFSDEDAEPLTIMGFAGTRWRFGEGEEDGS